MSSSFSWTRAACYLNLPIHVCTCSNAGRRRRDITQVGCHEAIGSICKNRATQRKRLSLSASSGVRHGVVRGILSALGTGGTSGLKVTWVLSALLSPWRTDGLHPGLVAVILRLWGLGPQHIIPEIPRLPVHGFPIDIQTIRHLVVVCFHIHVLTSRYGIVQYSRRFP